MPLPGGGMEIIMNKREISEIKKQFKKDNNAITRICGCYVDA